MILDVGCGDNPKGDINLDIKLYSDEIVRGKVVRTRADIIGDVNNLPFRDNSFDKVICHHLIEHLDKYIHAILGLIKVSRREVEIRVPHRYSRNAKAPYHKNYFSRSHVERVMKLLREKGIIKGYDVKIYYTILRPHEIEVKIYK